MIPRPWIAANLFWLARGPMRLSFAAAVPSSASLLTGPERSSIRKAGLHGLPVGQRVGV